LIAALAVYSYSQFTKKAQVYRLWATHIIRRALKEDYIARKEQPPKGKGNYLVIYYLTPKVGLY
jgi:hypothetical protein